ncbi:hypothetical protein J8B24_13420, partial [Vibrio parahaemolyticus]|nr:hypothetical protein [Vibrio parahaemolyticus]
FEGCTRKGLALLGSVIAAATGYGHLFSVEITETGVNLGGAVGLAIHEAKINACFGDFDAE